MRLLIGGIAALAIGACGSVSGGKAKLSVDTSSVDFGQVDCGATGPAQAVLIANTGNSAIKFTAALGGGASSPFTVTPSAGTLEPNAEISVLVIPKPTPAMAATTDGGIKDTLTLSSDAPGDSPQQVPVTMTAHGAVVAVSTPTVAFANTQKIGVPTTQPFTVTNNGNAPTNVIVTTMLDSFTVDETMMTLQPGASLDRTVTFSPLASGALDSQIVINASGPLCAPVPAAHATGTGTFGGTAAAVALMNTTHRSSSGLCVLLVGGQVACMGADIAGSRGAGPNVKAGSAPNLVRRDDGHVLDHVLEIASGRGQTCARRDDNSLWCWGNLGGNRVHTAINNSGSPIIDGQPFATQIASSVSSVAVIYGPRCTMSSAGLSCNQPHEHNGTTLDFSTWVASGSTPIPGTKIALNACGGYALQSDGTVLSFGTSDNGVRGNPGAASGSPASLVLDSGNNTLSNVTQVVAASTKFNGGTNRCGGACALKSDGTVWCWGSGARHGEIGNNAVANVATATQVLTAAATPLTGATQIASGRHHRCAITPTNVYCWGNTSHGEFLPSGSSQLPLATPLSPAIPGALSVAALWRGTCVVPADHSLTCLGQTAVSSGPAIAVPAFAP